MRGMSVFKFISRLFNTAASVSEADQRGEEKVAPATADTAAEHWSRWQAQVDTDRPRWVDWGEHPVFLELIYQQLFGSASTTLFDFLRQHYPRYQQQHALSLCSGDGSFERLLVDHEVFGHITGLDVSAYRVERARQQHAEQSARLSFTVGDVNLGNYGRNLYDVVFAKAALHHIENLEAAFAGMLHCLRPQGHLVTVDFFGPTRFQWTDKQLQLANEMLTGIPPELRTDRAGVLKSTVTRPAVEEMIAADPSEAVRSSELAGFIEQHFRVLQQFDIGGTLLNLVFTPDIICNFDPDNPAHRSLLQRLFAKERELIRHGDIPVDFRFLIAEKRPD